MVPDLIHCAVYESAFKTPEKTVFAIPGSAICYGDFVEQTSRLTRVLIDSGVRRGDRVGVYFQKSIESAVAIYATQQAGAAYVPLDPAAPVERTRAVLAQCGARVLVSHEAQKVKLNDLLPASLDVVIGPSDLAAEGFDAVPWSEVRAAHPADAMVSGASEMDLAYIIFTSGSTGHPKGIMHTHRSGMSYCRMAGALYEVGPHDRLTSLSPLHFDMSTFDYLCAPQYGAMTMIVPDPYTKLPASMSELVQEEALTIWYSVPFALTQLLLYGALEDHDLRSLRWVLFGGEPFAPKHLAALTEKLPNAKFSNVYGPAEVNQCTYYHLPPRWSEADGQPPIGAPCANTDVQIVDDALEAVEPGVVGELIVKSPSVMRGYWNRPNMNARALMRRPGAGGVDDLWLRTGDLAMSNAEGVLSFHGRVDRQVKVRGYRVELDEIEDVLVSHDAVEEAAAFPVRVSEDRSSIYAAVTIREGDALTSEALLQYASEQLPSYAVPGSLELVAAFPRTSSGKIDWKALGQEAEGRLNTGGTTDATGNQ